MEGEALLKLELAFVLLLSLAAVVAVVNRRVRLPYTVALVVVGLSLALFPAIPTVEVSSEFILALLVPPLIFEGTLGMPWPQLRRNLVPILLLAVIGVIAGSTIIGVVTSRLLGLPLAAAFAFGALISATDPVAVIAFFRRLGVDKRLQVLTEGESLINDGTSIVVFGLAVAGGGLAATSSGLSATLGQAVVEFARVSLGGVAVGLVLGYVVSEIVLSRVDDHLIETATTVALAFGAYVVAEELHVAGILAVVTAGLLVGTVGQRNTSPTTRLTLLNFWQFLAFVANSLVFLLIGLQVHVAEFGPYWRPILVAVLVVLAARAFVVYLLAALHGWLAPSGRIPMAYRHVMFWGGMRGAISLALALTLPVAVFGGQTVRELQHMTFGVVLFTLLVQGTTIEGLVRRLGLSEKDERRLVQERHQAKLYAAKAGRRELDRLLEEGILSRHVWRAMADAYESDIELGSQAVVRHMDDYPELELAMILQARQDVLRAERGALAEIVRRGIVSEDVASVLVRDVDWRATALVVMQTGRPAVSRTRRDTWRGE